MANDKGAIVKVSGLRELTRAFKAMDEAVAEDLVDSLAEAANPVKLRAQELALSEIRNLPRTPVYAAMRIGVSKAQGLVYMVPGWRAGLGARYKRRNFGTLLLERAMDPAVDEKQEEVVKGLEKLIDDVADRHGF